MINLRLQAWRKQKSRASLKRCNAPSDGTPDYCQRMTHVSLSRVTYSPPYGPCSRTVWLLA